MKKHRKWWGLAAMVPSLAVFFLDQTILPVALPTIQKEIGASHSALEWTVNAYLLASAVLVLVGGKISDRIGPRNAFIWGNAVFALASLFCGMANDIYLLIAGRVLQGVGGALMFPGLSVLLMALFPQSERGKATGINVSVSSLFLILGPLVGGYIVQKFTWNWIFWINIPLSLSGILLSFLFLPILPKGEGKIDLPGFLFFTSAATLFVLFVMQGSAWGWTSPKILSLFAGSLISAACLIWRERKTLHPFLELSLYKHPIFKAVNISVFATQFILMITVYRAIFFQDVLDWSPIKTGVITFISTLPVLFIPLVGGLLSDRFGPKIPIAIGFTCLIYSFFWVGFLVESSLPILLFGLIALGFGIPLVLTPSYASAMGAVPPTKAGLAFGTLSTVRALGNTLGVAIIGALLSNSEALSLRFRGVDLREAKIDSFLFTHLVLAFALILAFAFVFALFHRKSAHHLPETPAEGWD